MSRIPGRRRFFRGLAIPAVGFLAILGALGYLAWGMWFRPEVIYELSITGGKSPSPRQRSVEILRREAGPGLELRVLEFPGSVKVLESVNNREVDLALVQGGLGSKQWTNVTQVAALNLNPLQLVVRSELALEVESNLRCSRDTRST